MLVTCAVFHEPMSWLNATALTNMPTMFVTCEVFHDPMSWLKALASENMFHMLVTCPVFHDPMSWLNAAASWNMPPMSVTCAVSHAEISALNLEVLVTTPPHQLSPVGQSRNMFDMSVTSDTSQPSISHATPVGSPPPRHSATAALSASPSAKEAANAPGTHARANTAARTVIVDRDFPERPRHPPRRANRGVMEAGSQSSRRGRCFQIPRLREARTS